MQSKLSIIPGYVYHIKDEYFAVANDEMLMRNREGGTYTNAGQK